MLKINRTRLVGVTAIIIAGTLITVLRYRSLNQGQEVTIEVSDEYIQGTLVASSKKGEATIFVYPEGQYGDHYADLYNIGDTPGQKSQDPDLGMNISIQYKDGTTYTATALVDDAPMMDHIILHVRDMAPTKK